MAAYFPEVKKVQYEGTESKNPLAFRYYNPDEKIEGKTMKDHFRFSASRPVQLVFRPHRYGRY